jgi:aryl-alcohol dehydrogenase-like predicted oxidoreductase
MDNVTLGKSGIRVSRICLGTMTFGNPIEEIHCRRLVSHALDKRSELLRHLQFV